MGRKSKIFLTGQKFGKLLVLKEVSIVTNYGIKRHWKCKCDCGTITVVLQNNLLKKITPTRSCGCVRTTGQTKIIYGNKDSLSLSRKLFNQTRNSRIAKTLGFNLTKEWILERLNRGCCDVTGINFRYCDNYRDPFRASLDRIDNKKGYFKENVRIVIWLYNIARHTNSDDDVMIMAEALVKQKSKKLVRYYKFA